MIDRYEVQLKHVVYGAPDTQPEETVYVQTACIETEDREEAQKKILDILFKRLKKEIEKDFTANGEQDKRQLSIYDLLLGETICVPGGQLSQEDLLREEAT